MSTASRLFTLTAFVGLVFGCGASSADEPAAEGGRKLTVSANAIVQAEPDSAMISFSLVYSGTKAKDAREAVDKRVNAIRDAVNALGLKNVSLEIVPVPLNVMIAGNPLPDGSQPPVGYQAKCNCWINVREKDKAKLRDMVVRIGDTVAENGGLGPADDTNPLRFRAARFNAIGGPAQPPETVPGPAVEWLCENDSVVRQDAVKRAVNDALATAHTVAGKSQLKVVEVSVQPTVSSGSRIRAALVGNPVQTLGTVAIEVTVNVTCTY
jgi:uncharacterized protein YggE